MTETMLLVGWLACGFLAYGVSFAYFQREYPELAAKDYILDRCISATCGLLGGPFTLIVALMMCYPWRGFKWR